MPQVYGNAWRHYRARMDITSDDAAALLKIAGGALRQIETGVKPASLALAYRAARLYGCDVSDLVATGEGVPDEPPKKKEGGKAPTRRKESTTRPKRPEHSEAIAS